MWRARTDRSQERKKPSRKIQLRTRKACDDQACLPPDADAAATTPASTDVAPVYVFAADKMSVLVDEIDFVSAPSPEMIPDRV